MMKRAISIFGAMLFLVLGLHMSSMESQAANVQPFTSTLDYSKAENWLYDGAYPENGVDVFMVAPSVDTKSENNSSMTDGYKKAFRNAMNQQQAIYANTARIYAPYYRQASLNAYSMTDTAAKKQVFENAYMDVSAAFKYYLKNKNNGRPLIIAGFSQGADMCYRILEEYYGGDGKEAVELRDNLIAVYAIGWPMTKEMIEKYPQIVPASGETDTGVVVSFECEDGNVTDSLTVPAGTKMISINPLNWRTDSKFAPRSLNKGSVTQDSKTGAITSVEVGKHGAYIDPNRGTLIVSNLGNIDDYFTIGGLFPTGSLHLYDNFLFFVNLQENVQKRTNSFLQQRAADDAA